MRRVLLLVPCLLAGITCAAWVWQSDRPGAVHGLALLLWLMGAVIVLVELRRPVEGLLRWDGLQWSLEAAGRLDAGAVRPRLDWQQGLLLEFQSLDGKGCWLWPERLAAPLYWDALRRAVYAPVPVAADPGRPPRAGAGS
jgi:hypothetical protein